MTTVLPTTGVQPRHEGAHETLISGMADNVIDAVGPGDLHGVVDAAIVDYQPLDRVESRRLARQSRQRHRVSASL